MRSLSELVDTEDPGIEKIREWIRSALNNCVLLPPSIPQEYEWLSEKVFAEGRPKFSSDFRISGLR
jgi:hypothetical protein